MARPSLRHAAMATAALCAALMASFCAGVLYEGRRTAQAATAELQQLQRRQARATAWMRDERATSEDTLRAEIQALQTQLSNAQGAANATHQDHLSGLRAGTVRVRVPIVPASCAAGLQPAGHAGAATAATHAELEPAAATELAGIAHDGDAGIRELNQCIGQYNSVRTALGRWRATLKATDVQTP